MIISTNKEPSLEEFELLCNRMCEYMNKKAKEEPAYYLSKGAQRLEPEVKAAAANKNRVEEIVMSMDEKTLSATWNIANTGYENRMKYWINLVVKSAELEHFDVKRFLEDLFHR